MLSFKFLLRGRAGSRRSLSCRSAARARVPAGNVQFQRSASRRPRQDVENLTNPINHYQQKDRRIVEPMVMDANESRHPTPLPTRVNRACQRCRRNKSRVSHVPLGLIKTHIQYSATHTGHARSVPEPMPAASRMKRLGKVVLKSEY